MRYLSHVDEYLTLKYKYKYKYSGHKYKYKYKYFKMVLEYYSSTSTSTKYYISATDSRLFRSITYPDHCLNYLLPSMVIHLLARLLNLASLASPLGYRTLSKGRWCVSSVRILAERHTSKVAVDACRKSYTRLWYI